MFSGSLTCDNRNQKTMFSSFPTFQKHGSIDLLSFRRNFEKNRNRQKYYHTLKGRPKLSKIAKFGCKMF